MSNCFCTSDLIAEPLEQLADARRESALQDAGLPIPNRKKIIQVLEDLLALFFPMAYTRPDHEMSDEHLLSGIYHTLLAQTQIALNFDAHGPCPDCDCRAAGTCQAFLRRLPEIKKLLYKDIQALYEGDPAARSPEEVLICYPGFYAISIYRIAHVLYELDLPLIPRIMTEYAHEKTGIDIHAGATVGEYFFIDHGTGIVIGETTVIGDHVKLYQGVTLGAKSFETDADGNPVKGVKRHPNIGNNVVIYVNAPILGGNTYIGDGCVIGGNTWLTRSVEPGKTVYYNG